MANRPLSSKLSGRTAGRPGLRGIDTVMLNLRKEIAKMELKGVAGLIAGAEIIRRDMDVTPPLIPVETGALKDSWYTKVTKSTLSVEMGFKAKHAIYVHEKKWKHGKRPGSGPKFFEKAVKRNKAKVLAAIRASIILK
jgi:hypothetical protein